MWGGELNFGELFFASTPVLKKERNMKKFALIAAASAAFGMVGLPAYAGAIDQGLEEVFAATPDDEIISALVFLWEQGDARALAAEHRAQRVPFSRRNEEVVRELRDIAELTQAPLRAELGAMRAEGSVHDFEAYWIANIIRVDATEAKLREIATRPEVNRVYYNMPIESIGAVQNHNDMNLNRRGDRPRGDRERQTTLGGVEAGVAAVKAPEVWNMGFTGQGVLIATMDTGVDGNHPALASRWRGLDPQYAGNPEWAWFDPITNTTFPEEFGWSSHGTHTMGTVLGGAPGDQIGVAPGAQWIHAGVIDRGGIDATIANAILSFQWMASPTGNPSDFWAVPRVASNSWGTTASMGHPACDETFWIWIDNSEAAGTAQFFSAGNEGASGLRRPADRATDDFNSVAVAAINPYISSWPAADFSSRGPTSCTPSGSTAIKPDISAPGVDTRSAVSGGGYGTMSGTSMASPHINGVAALMLEACDILTSDEIKQIMYETAVHLGSPGKNNTYGYGMVDAEAAVTQALAQCTIGLRLPDGTPNLLDPGVSESFIVEVIEGTESVVPGSEVLYYRTDGGTFEVAMLTPNGDGLYTATLPTPTCDDTVEFYVQIEGDGGSIRTSPNHAPDSVYTAAVGDLVTVTSYEQAFAGGLPSGWSATGLWNFTSDCAVSGDCPSSQWAYYGNTGSCNYETPGSSNNGELISAPINVPSIPPGGTVSVSFCYNLDTEASASYDQARFGVAGETTTLLSDSNNWTTFTQDITAHAGETINLRWHFDTLDALYNDYRGWQVDNVVITVTALQCEDPTPACPADLTGDGTVNVGDMLELLAAWGDCNGCAADLNGDGTVDVSDLLELLAAWGDC